MEKIKNVLEEIEKNPVLFLGELSLERLSFYLAGYEHACHKLTSIHPYFNTYFQTFVEIKYKDAWCTKHWSRILRENSSDEKEALQLFFCLFKEMYTEWADYFKNNDSPDEVLNIAASLRVNTKLRDI